MSKRIRSGAKIDADATARRADSSEARIHRATQKIGARIGATCGPESLEDALDRLLNKVGQNADLGLPPRLVRTIINASFALCLAEPPHAKEASMALLREAFNEINERLSGGEITTIVAHETVGERIAVLRLADAEATVCMLQADVPKLRAELADANAALEGALDAQEDAEQRMFSMRRERDAAKDCANGQGTVVAGPCGVCLACTRESLERMRARVKSADDLFEKSMDAIHDRAGIKRNGLAGILAWIDEAHDIRSKVNGP